MRKISAIAINTFREAVRDKILYAMLAFALVMLGGSLLVAELTIGEYEKIIKDLGLSLISIFGLMIAVFVGIGLVYKEIERKKANVVEARTLKLNNEFAASFVVRRCLRATTLQFF